MTQPASLSQTKARYEAWLKAGVFSVPVPTDKKHRPSIMMPPPNVTGSLHMGHALNLTLQDVLYRFLRMQGHEVLWQPGMDHAGIATQMVVERQLEKEGSSRKALGREAFVERVWSWKEESGGQILDQQKTLGVCADWDRARFTMDEGLSKAVREVFVRLFDEGLIYKDEKLVNWDTVFQTAISDVEVNNEVRQGKFYYFRYPLVDAPDRYLVIATTRPETMFGDVAVAVHPEDERYQDLIGKMVRLPLTDREIPIVADTYCDPEKGTGAVKITPAHDFNDFEVGQRHSLERITVMDPQGKLAGSFVPEAFQGLAQMPAREKIIAALEGLGLLEKIEDKEITVPLGERSGAVVEPRLTPQWFVNMKPLAEKALKAVADGETVFLPENWTKVYNDWLENIEPWCISRQLWWGHQIPIWYGPDQTAFAAQSLEEASEKAKAHYGKTVELVQEEDVLDTWFSSALWPFSTLGWPEKTPELDVFYPTHTLITGFDIIFFWVARMIMMGLHFTGKVPFKTVYIHALVLDEKGQKMSKSKGNAQNPLDLIGEYGPDALRYALAINATPGRDVRFSPAQVEQGRNFITKLRNAARFVTLQREKAGEQQASQTPTHFLNKWILQECSALIPSLTKQMEAYRYDLALQALQQFTRDLFCDWYLELTKPLFEESADPMLKAETIGTMEQVLQIILRLFHPFCPFASEEIWEGVFEAQFLIYEKWPEVLSGASDDESQQLAQDLIALISAIRTARGELSVPPKALAPLYASADHPLFEKAGPLLKKLARISEIHVTSAPAGAALQVQALEQNFVIPLEGLIDIGAEKQRLEKVIAKAEKEIKGLSAKLSNKTFTENAPAAVIEKNTTRLAEEQARSKAAAQALQSLS